MSGSHTNTFPKIHNAMWPGLVGKGSPDAEPTIDLDTMLNLTAAAQVDGIRFDGVDIFLYEPHINIDISDEALKAVAGKIADKGFVVGSVVAPVWFDASAMGDQRQRDNYLTAIRKACRIAKKLRELGVRPSRRGPHRLRRPRPPTGPKTRRVTSKRSPKPSSGPPRSLAITANAWPPKEKSAGAGCTRGARWSICSKRSANLRPSAFRPICPHTLLVHARRKRTAGPDLAQGLRLERPRCPLTRPAARTADGSRYGPGRLIFMSRRTTARSSARAPTTTPAATRLATDPNGKPEYPPSRGILAPRRERQAHQEDPPHLLGRLYMFPNAVMTDPKTWTDILPRR